MTEAIRALRRRRLIIGALLASLALNAFFIGQAVTEHWWGGKPNWRGERAVTFELRRIASDLSEAEVQQVRAALEPIEPEIAARMDKLRALRREIARMAGEPQPDRAAIDARLAETRAEATEIQTRVAGATYDAVLALPAEARAGLGQGDPDRR